MPGWYVHMEAARMTVDRLRAGEGSTDPHVAKDLGEVCYRWRNYLELGSLGPDLFYLLPDFANTKGSVIRKVVKWCLEVWREVDGLFVSRWERWILPIDTNASQLASQITGGLSNQLAQVMDEVSSAIGAALRDLLRDMGDWFGVLTSGLPQGYEDDAFYWSDVFHYRRTYQFPSLLYRNATAARAAAVTDAERDDAEAMMAFAVGWLTHCATDVTGHPFTNAKAGGPYRDHWQRHHLVENHVDSLNYTERHGTPCYGDYGTSALHFRIAFRHRDDGVYAGRDDAPAYDFFGDFPAYDTADTPTAAAKRHALFDLDTGPLPDHLVDAMTSAMAALYPDGPRILAQDPQYSMTTGGVPDGRPNPEALDQMWTLVYDYLKLISSDGLGPMTPTPPSVFTDHSFPTPPGGGAYGVDDDPSRGAEVDDDDDDSFNLLDLILAVIAWIAYIAEVVVWLVTVLPGLVLDPLTFPAREAIYHAVVVPLWNLYLLARRTLVMTGFMMPKPEETDPGLTTLGVAQGIYDVGSALDDPSGAGTPRTRATEPSGRATAREPYGLDEAYPRNVVRDAPGDIEGVDLVGAFDLTDPLRYRGDAGHEMKPSEWVAPWRYPLTNQAAKPVWREGGRTHVGPWVIGETGDVLLGGATGTENARHRLELADSPAKTEEELDDLLTRDEHLGAPTDYGLYLVGRMLLQGDDTVPDFNLDSDRGYGWQTWAWDRHGFGKKPGQEDQRGKWECVPDLTAAGGTNFRFAQPCTPPQFFHADHDNPAQVDMGTGVLLDTQWYDPLGALHAHYLRGPQPPTDLYAGACDPEEPQPPVDGAEWPHAPFGGER